DWTLVGAAPAVVWIRQQVNALKVTLRLSGATRNDAANARSAGAAASFGGGAASADDRVAAIVHTATVVAQRLAGKWDARRRIAWPLRSSGGNRSCHRCRNTDQLDHAVARVERNPKVARTINCHTAQIDEDSSERVQIDSKRCSPWSQIRERACNRKVRINCRAARRTYLRHATTAVSDPHIVKAVDRDPERQAEIRTRVGSIVNGRQQLPGIGYGGDATVSGGAIHRTHVRNPGVTFNIDCHPGRLGQERADGAVWGKTRIVEILYGQSGGIHTKAGDRIPVRV